MITDNAGKKCNIVGTNSFGRLDGSSSFLVREDIYFHEKNVQYTDSDAKSDSGINN